MDAPSSVARQKPVSSRYAAQSYRWCRGHRERNAGFRTGDLRPWQADVFCFAGIIELAHEAVHRIDLGARLSVGGGAFAITHPRLNVLVEPCLRLHPAHARYICDTLTSGSPGWLALR